MSVYTSFRTEWNGRRIDYDHVYSFQCVDLILEYCKEVAHVATGIWGNAIDYWYHPSPAFVAACAKISKTSLKQGDIVVLTGLSGNPYGHIGILDSATATSVRLLEQNATGSADGLGRSAIGVWRDIPMSRVLGGWRIKATIPAPAPVPARLTVYLPANNQSWNLYRVGSYLRPNTSDVIAKLAPAYFGGLTYKVVARVGDYAVVIDTQMFGRGTIWIKGTNAVLK